MHGICHLCMLCEIFKNTQTGFKFCNKCHKKSNIFVAYMQEKCHNKCVMTCSGPRNWKPFCRIN